MAVALCRQIIWYFVYLFVCLMVFNATFNNQGYKKIRLIRSLKKFIFRYSKIKIKFQESLYDFLADHDREDLNKFIAELFKLSVGVLVFSLGSDSAKEQLVWPSESGNETNCQLLCLFLNPIVRLLLFCLYMLVIPIKYVYTKWLFPYALAIWE
jgi:hypothetical protein